MPQCLFFTRGEMDLRVAGRRGCASEEKGGKNKLILCQIRVPPRGTTRVIVSPTAIGTL